MNMRKWLRLPLVLVVLLTLLVGSINPAGVPVAQAVGTWTSTGSMAAGRSSHTATLLPSGKVLVAGGYTSSFGYLASAELYDAGAGTFSPTGSMATARYGHTATLLPNGKVLIAGGIGAGASTLASAELYDPGPGTWTATTSMSAARQYHTATLLPNGKVLIAGGGSGSSSLASAELYDPGAGTWTATTSMGAARQYHTATLLPNGKVLIAGGASGSGYLASAELYNPGAGTFSPTGNMATSRYAHTATLLASGTALVAGGFFAIGNSSVASAELYDANSGTFSPTGSMAAARSYHTATLLPSGDLLVAGGAGPGQSSPAELYNAGAGTFSVTGSMTYARYLHTATRLNNGCVVVAGGTGGGTVQATAELFKEVNCGTGPDLAITKVGVVSGSTVTYTITVTNIGGVPAATPVQVTDSLPTTPAGMQFGTVSANCSGGSAGPIVCTDPNHPTPLGPGQSFTSTIVLNVGAAGGAVTNCASVSQGSNAATPADPDLANNRACVTNTVPPATPPSACVAPPSGMVGWWPADNHANDLAGTNHGTLMNGAAYAPGKVAAAFSLPGANDYVKVPNGSSLNPGTGDFSLDAWVLTKETTGTSDILDKRTRTAGIYTGYALFVSNGRLGIQLADGGAGAGFTNYVATSPMIADGDWHHVAAIVTRGSATGGTLFVDGAIVLTFDPTGRSGSLTTTADLSIGQESFGGFNFQGLIDEVEFFNRTLDFQEVRNIHKADSAGKCKTNPEVDLSISKRVSDTTAPNQKVFLLSVANLGPGTISSGTITVTDVLPAGFTVLPPAPGGGSWTCVVAGANPPATLTCTWLASAQPVGLGALPPISVTVSAAAAGSFENCARVALSGANVSETILANNTSCVKGDVGAPPLSCVAPPSGMVGWWPGDNHPNDIAGTAHGTLMGGAAYAPGKVAAAFSLPGANDYVKVPNGPSLNPGTGDFSLDAWVLTKEASGTSDILDKRTRTVNGVYTGYALFVSNGRFGIQLADGGAGAGFTNYISTSPMIADGDWHHVAAIVTRGSATGGTLFVNGVVVLTFDPTGRSGSLTTIADLSIGQESFGGFNFQGLIDEVEFFNRTLDFQEVRNIYNAGSAGKCKPKSMPMPTPVGPADGFVSVDMAPLLQWTNPPGTTQYQIQVIPFRNDGPGINLIRDVETSYQVQAPLMGTGNYVILPGMSYTWRVRTTQATTAVGENDPGWSAWAEPIFVTAPPSSAGIRLVSPAEGSMIFDRWGNLIWDNAERNVFYYEVQVSKDPSFNTDPNTAIASVYWNLIHGGQTMPRNSYTIPTNAPLELDSTYYWHVRPRVQGDGAPVAWSSTWMFRTPAIDVPATDQQLRQAATSSVLAAARRAGVAVDATGLVYASRDDAVIVAAGTAGAEDLTRRQIEAGVDVLFTYLSLPDSKIGLPAGFYTVNVMSAPGADLQSEAPGTARLRNEAGRVVADVPARVSLPQQPDPAAKPTIKCKLTVEFVTIDMACPFGARIMVGFDLAESLGGAAAGPPDMSMTEQQVRQAATSSVVAAARRAGVAADPTGLSYASLEDTVIVNAGIAGVENLTRSQLEAGADVLFTYLWLRNSKTGLPAGFYTVNVTWSPGADPGSEAPGIARLRNEAGRVVAEARASVSLPQESDAAAAKPRIKCKLTVIDIECVFGVEVKVDLADM